MDVSARMELFDLKQKYSFQTTPGVDQYNMPLYGINAYPYQTPVGGQSISYYPVYQGFLSPMFINGSEIPLATQRGDFFRAWPNYIQPLQQAGTGDGGTTYTLTLPFMPALQGHVDITGIIANGGSTDPIVGTAYQNNVPVTSVNPAVWVTTIGADGQPVVVYDSGQFLSSNQGLGFLTGDVATSWSSTENVVNYASGVINVTFDVAISAGVPINVQCYFQSQGMPTQALFYNNVLTLRTVPDTSYLVEVDAYLTPAAFLSTGAAIPFAYMCEYLARGAARKMLSDTGDTEQFFFYEPLFVEQEALVWKRSQRQVTSTRTQTIFSAPSSQSSGGNIIGQGT